MMTVRFPSGVSVTYNDASWLKYGQHAHELFTADPSKGGLWIVSIPAGADCIIEARPCCKVEQAALTVQAAAQHLAQNETALRAVDGWVLRDLKRALQRFNARSQSWS